MTKRQGIFRVANVEKGVYYGCIVAFLFASLILGNVGKMYDRFWWWDDMLHAISGVLLVVTGSMLARRMAPRGSELSLLFTVLFAFCFALAGGVLWEVYEFTSDIVLHTALQQYNMPPQAIVMGASYQGMGLRDTMSDLINGIGGALGTMIVLYSVRRRTYKDYA